MSGSEDSIFSSPRYLSLYASFNAALNAEIVAKWKKCGFLSFGSGSAFIIFDHVTFFVCGSNDELRFYSENFLRVGYFSKSRSETSAPQFSLT